MSKTYKIGTTQPDNKTKGGRGSNKYVKQQIKAAKDQNAYRKAFKETQKKMEKFEFDKIPEMFIEGLKKLSKLKKLKKIKGDK